jgi:hypothetical protein
MRAVESTSADEDPVTLVEAPRSGANSVIPDDLESSDRYTMGHSLCPHYRQLLLELLVQLFAVGTRFVPLTARRVLVPSQLPPVLERVALQAQRSLQAWVAWTEEQKTWFVVAEMATVPASHCRGEAIRMFFYDEDGRRVSWGTWALQSERSWMLCER